MKAYRPNWSVVNVTGADAVSFVHNLCTNDIKKLTEGQACEAFFTDVKAHVVAHAVVVRTGNGCQIVVTSPRAEELASHLERYHIQEELELAVTEFASALIIEGERQHGWIEGLQASLARDASDVEGFETMTDEAFHVYRMELGFPLDLVDVDATRLPQEVNRDPLAISFTKGCYLGQETVARIDALGRVNWKLVRLRLEGENLLSPGDALSQANKEVGRVTSVCYSERLNAPLLMAYVRRECSESGAVLESLAGTATVLSESLL